MRFEFEGLLEEFDDLVDRLVVGVAGEELPPVIEPDDDVEREALEFLFWRPDIPAFYWSQGWKKEEHGPISILVDWVSNTKETGMDFEKAKALVERYT